MNGFVKKNGSKCSNKDIKYILMCLRNKTTKSSEIIVTITAKLRINNPCKLLEKTVEHQTV